MNRRALEEALLAKIITNGKCSIYNGIITLVKLRFYNPKDSLFYYFPRKFKSSLRVIRASALAAEVCE